MQPFHYADGAYRAQWDAFEITIFAAMVRAVIATIQSGDNTTPEYQKLFPPVSMDDAAAAEFNRLSGKHISDVKQHNLMQFGLTLVTNLPATGDDMQAEVEVVIPESEANAALQALTAIRVYLGARLEIENDLDSEILYHQFEATADAPAEPSEQGFLANVFFASGYVQETLVQAMMARM